MRERRIRLMRWMVRGRNRLLGLDRYADPRSYFGRGGLEEARARCAEANRDLPAFVRPPAEVTPARLVREGSSERRNGLCVEDWSFDSPLPSGVASNDRVQFRVYLPPTPAPRDRVILFHHPLYQKRWTVWEWFLADLRRQVPVAFMAAPWHLGRAGDGRFPGEGMINPNPARMFEAIRQWCWDHQATAHALEHACGMPVAAEIGFSLGAFQLLLLASAGRIDVPMVSIASTNRFAWGLTHGVLGSELLHAMRQVGIDERRLFEMTDSIQLERHVGALHHSPILYLRGLRDWVDPEPSLDRLEQALRPTRSVRLQAGHVTLLLRRQTVLREVVQFLEQNGALPSAADSRPADH